MCSHTYRLVDSYSDGSLGHVEDDTGSAVIVLERHALVDRGIHFDIDIISSLIISANVVRALDAYEVGTIDDSFLSFSFCSTNTSFEIVGYSSNEISKN